jgi:hypothetical protein
VAKSQDGTIERLAIGDDEDFGSLLAAVVPVANGGPAVAVPAGGSALTRPMRRRWPILSNRGPPCLLVGTLGRPLLAQSPRPAAR